MYGGYNGSHLGDTWTAVTGFDTGSPTPTLTPTAMPTATDTPTPTPTPTATPTGTSIPAQFAATQSCAIVSDGHFFAAVYNISGGGTEDSVDTNDAATLTYTKANNTWFGAYVYDYETAAWVRALHIYHQDL